LEEATRPVPHPHAHCERLRTHPHTHNPASQVEIGAGMLTRPASIKAADREFLLKQGEADVLADEACLTVNMVNRQVTDPHARQVAGGLVARSGREGTPHDRHGKHRTQEQYATPAHGQSRAGPLLTSARNNARGIEQRQVTFFKRPSNMSCACRKPHLRHILDEPIRRADWDARSAEVRRGAVGR